MKEESAMWEKDGFIIYSQFGLLNIGMLVFLEDKFF